MQKIFFKLFSFLSISLFTLFLIPSLSYSYTNLTGWTHFGIRPLGMGNAFVAVSDDYNAIFYNPAGIGLHEGFSLQLLNVNVAISKNVVSLIKDFRDASNDEKKDNDGTNTSSSKSSYLDVVNKNIGKANLLNLSMTPYLHFSNFEVALGIDAGVSIAIKRDPAVKLVGGARGIAPVGYAMKFYNGRLRVGAALKFVYQALVDDELGVADIQDLDSMKTLREDYLRLGAGLGLDVGVLVSQPDSKLKPTLGLSIANIGGIKNLRSDTNKRAVILHPAINSGISLRLYHNNIITITTAADVHAINQNMDFSKKFGAGLEFDIYSLLKIQTGLYQGYYTAGINLDLFLLNLRLVTYAEEAGEYAGSMENRVYMLELKLII